MKALVLTSQCKAKNKLGAAIGKLEFKKDFVSKLVEKWVLQIKVLSDLPSLIHTLSTLPSPHAFDIGTPSTCVPFLTLSPSFSLFKMPSTAF